jgi:hypothetical protein
MALAKMRARPAPAGNDLLYSYALTEAATVSSGVFRLVNGEEVLVAVVEANVKKEAGTYVLRWDGYDYEGNLLTVEQVATCYPKVRDHKLVHEHLKTIGNNSADLTGAAVWNDAHQATSAKRVGKWLMIATSYSEGEATSMNKCLVSDPKRRVRVHQKEAFAATIVESEELFGQPLPANTRVRVGWAGVHGTFTPNRGPNGNGVNVYGCYILLTEPQEDDTDLDVQLSGATVLRYNGGLTHYAIAYLASPEIPRDEQWDGREFITGLAMSLEFYWVARAKMGVIETYTRSTGNLLNTWSVTDPRHLTLTGPRILWMIQEVNTPRRFDLSDQGVGTATDKTLAGMTDPVSLRASEDYQQLVAQDGSRANDPTTTATHKICWYSATTTVLLHAEQAAGGGYSASPELLPNKYAFLNAKKFGNTPSGNSVPFVAWVGAGMILSGEPGSFRNQFIRTDTYEVVDTLEWIGYFYNCVVDVNYPDPDVICVFAQYMEYLYYWKTNTYVPVRSWLAGYRANFDDDYNRLLNATTFPTSKRRYAFHQRQDPKDAVVLIELDPATGIRYSTQYFPSRTRIYADGSLWVLEGELNGVIDNNRIGDAGTRMVWSRFPLVNDPATGWPTWGEKQLVRKSPVLGVNSPTTPGGYLTQNMQAPNGTIVSFCSATRPGFHIATLHPGTVDQWAALAAPATFPEFLGPYPLDGGYEIGHGVGNTGGFAQAIGELVLHNQYDEFYENRQTAMDKLHHQDGLPVDTSGAVNSQGDPLENAAYNLTSNAKTGLAVIRGNAIYKFTNDEGMHGGICCKRSSGLDTIRTRRLSLYRGTLPVEAGVYLLQGLPFNTAVASGQYGMKFTPETGALVLHSSVYTYGKGRDVAGFWYPQRVADSFLGIWEVCALPSYDNQVGFRLRDVGVRFLLAAFGKAANNGQPARNAYIELLDKAGRVGHRLARLEITNEDCPLLYNGRVVASRSTEAWRKIINPGPAFELLSTPEGARLSYGPFAPLTVTEPAEAGADMLRPVLLRVRYDTPDGGTEFGVGFTAKLHFLALTSS